MINQHEFYILYVNAHAMVHLSMRQVAEEILEMPVEPAPELTPEELEARLKADYENGDWSALDGIDFSFPLISDPTAVLEEAMQIVVEPSEDDFDALGGGEFDMQRFLNWGYDDEHNMRERMRAYHQRADFHALESRLRDLPSDFPSLIRRLSSDDMTRLLTAFREDHAGLLEIVGMIRALDN